MSLALFTDSDSVGANTFSTGTIVLTTSPTSALVTFSNMFPNDSVGPNELTVSNTGGGQLRYAMTSSSTDVDNKHLATQLVVTVKTEGTDCATFDGTTLYTGALSNAFFGDPTAGDDTDDRTLNSGSSEVLCFKVDLPFNTGNAFQNASTTATFTFASEQTASNP
jgi:hypothetical protein